MQEDQEDGSSKKQNSTGRQRLQDDSPVGRKKKKKKPLSELSSGKMVELMRKFVTQTQEDRNNDAGQEASGTKYDSKEQRDGHVSQVSEAQVLRKQGLSFASVDLRMKKTFGSGS